jgi:hypothetical protein
LQVTAYHQIQPAVAVIVDKRADRTPLITVVPKASLFSDVGKCAVAVVSVKNILSPIRQEKVFKTIVIEISDGNSRRPASLYQARFLGYIGKCSVAIVMVEPIVVPGGAPSSRVPFSRKMSSHPSLS